jgi:hypothetical protein
MLQHNGIAKCQIMFPSPSRVVNCAMRPPDKYFPSLFSHLFIPPSLILFSSFPLMRMRVLFSYIYSQPVAPNVESKNIACFSVIKGLLRLMALCRICHTTGWNADVCGVRWVRRRGVKSWRERGCNSPPLLANAWMAAWRALSGNSGSLHYGAHELLLRLFSSPAIKCQDYVAGLLRINYTRTTSFALGWWRGARNAHSLPQEFRSFNKNA